MVKSGLDFFILKLKEPLQRYLLTCQANSVVLDRFFCTGQQQLWRGSWNFKIIFSRPLFNIIFNPKMVISRVKILAVLADVIRHSKYRVWHIIKSIFSFLSQSFGIFTRIFISKKYIMYILRMKEGWFFHTKVPV